MVLSVHLDADKPASDTELREETINREAAVDKGTEEEHKDMEVESKC